MLEKYGGQIYTSEEALLDSNQKSVLLLPTWKRGSSKKPLGHICEPQVTGRLPDRLLDFTDCHVLLEDLVSCILAPPAVVRVFKAVCSCFPMPSFDNSLISLNVHT